MSTPRKTVRVPDELWDRAGQVLAAQGNNRTAAIVEFLQWIVDGAEPEEGYLEEIGAGGSFPEVSTGVSR